MKRVVGRFCVVLALLVMGAGGAEAEGEHRVISLKACIDGLTNLHVKNGELSWKHLAFAPPGKHFACTDAVSTVDGVPWHEWKKAFRLPVSTDSANIAFHPVQCRGNCVLVQSPSAENGWEAIYQFDDFTVGSSSPYCVNIVIGGPPESAAKQSVQHIEPAPRNAGGKPIFRGNGGTLRKEACGQDLVSEREAGSFRVSDPSGGPVNAFLWRAALDTINFIPLASADPFGGGILTDWYAPADTPDERLKVQITFPADGVKVAVFKQRKSATQDGWVDAPVDAATGSEIENAIVARARQLRIARTGT
jgi:hypothetical protein